MLRWALAQSLHPSSALSSLDQQSSAFHSYFFPYLTDPLDPLDPLEPLGSVGKEIINT
jgi:hypothetical protein